MQGKINRLMAGLIVAGLVLVFMGAAIPSQVKAAEITLNLGHPFPEKLVTLTSWEKWFAQEIEKRTDGRVKIKIFWAQSLGKTSDLPDLVKSGGVDMTMLVPGYYPALFPWPWLQISSGSLTGPTKKPLLSPKRSTGWTPSKASWKSKI